MDQRVNMIMVGAKNIAKIKTFYEQGLGFTPWMPNSASYKVGVSVLIFLPAEYLAQERGYAVGDGGNFSLAVFVESKVKVDEFYKSAISAGAKETSGPRDRDGGLYTGYFSDPEGNSWEVVWSPVMPITADGSLGLPN